MCYYLVSRLSNFNSKGEKIMMNIFSLLATTDTNAEDLVNQAFGTFKTIVNIVLPVLMTVLLIIGMFYGIQLGVKYAKAEEEEEKKKAKGSLINVLVGVLIAIIFVAVVEIVLNMNFVKKMFVGITGGAGSGL